MAILKARFCKSFLIVLGSCLICTSFIISTLFAGRPDLRYQYFNVFETLHIFHVTGIVVPIILFFMTFKYRDKWLVENGLTFKADKMKVAFLWLFGLVAMAYTAVKMSISVVCAMQDGEDMFPGKREFRITNYIFEIMFYVAQLAFITYFSQFKLSSPFPIGIALMFLLIADLTFWFQSMLSTITWSLFISDVSLNISSGNSCFNESPIQSFREKIHPYTRTAKIEYYLLATAFVLRLWSTTEESSRANTYNLLTNGDTATGLMTDNSEARSTHVFNFYTPNTHRGRAYKPASYYVALLISLIVCLPMFVLNNIIVFNIGTDDMVCLLFECSVFVVFLVQIFILLASFYSLNNQTTSVDISYRARSNDSIIIFSTAGSIAVEIFRVLRCYIHIKEISPKLAMFISKTFLDMIGIFLQTMLLLISSKCRISRTTISKNNYRLENLFVSLYVINLIIWFTDSFFSSKSMAVLELHGHDNSNWNLLFNLIGPISMFYRFNVAMESFERYEYFSKRRNEIDR